MILDCIIIGGGPAGLNASLVLGRSRRRTILFDDNQPRNAVTNEAHGFITRDGINPSELRSIAQEELGKYPDIQIKKQRVHSVHKIDQHFTVQTETGEVYKAKKVILATGFKETLPNIERIDEYYGTSLFSCPFCDGWELRDRSLAIIAENNGTATGDRIFHMAKVVYNWTKELIVCTNGDQMLSVEQQNLLETRGIKTYEQEISSLIGENGYLDKIKFQDGTIISREGGFIGPKWEPATPIGQTLGCELNELGGIKSDVIGRTNVEGVFACGDATIDSPSQLVIAAAAGSKAAMGVNAALIEETFS